MKQVEILKLTNEDLKSRLSDFQSVRKLKINA